MSEHVDLTEQYDEIAAAHRAHDEKKAERLIVKLMKDHPKIFQGEGLRFALAMEDRGAVRHCIDEPKDNDGPRWSYKFPT